MLKFHYKSAFVLLFLILASAVCPMAVHAAVGLSPAPVTLSSADRALVQELIKYGESLCVKPSTAIVTTTCAARGISKLNLLMTILSLSEIQGDAPDPVERKKKLAQIRLEEKLSRELSPIISRHNYEVLNAQRAIADPKAYGTPRLHACKLEAMFPELHLETSLLTPDRLIDLAGEWKRSTSKRVLRGLASDNEDDLLHYLEAQNPKSQLPPNQNFPEMIRDEVTDPSSVHNSRIDGTEIPPEDNGVNGVFYIPNEHRYEKWIPAVAELEGTLISVGTFRSLFAFSAGHFNRLFQLDRSDDITKFNHANLDIILQSADHWEYLNHLLAGGNAEEATERVRQGYITEETYLKMLNEFRVRHRWYQSKTESGQRMWMITFDDELFEVVKSARTNPERKAISIFWNEEVFERIKRAIEDGRIIAITGDLTGPQTLVGIGRTLKKRHEKVSAIDISNSWNQMRGEEVRKAFERNLASLPFEPKAVFMFTGRVGYMPPPSYNDSWEYFWTDISSTLSCMHDRKFREKGNPFEGIMRQLRKQARAQSHESHEQIVEDWDD